MFIRLIKKWYALLLSVFWARKCAGCGQISEDGLFCSVCREVLLQPLWLSGREALDGVGMLFRYNGALKTALQNVKFKNRRIFWSCWQKNAAGLVLTAGRNFCGIF